ncbi:Integrase core domain-containing protein [Lutibacter oricola]|uniref:Integrase core domain-containing protein n=1 Tax=Lutibacter oricola TaxID=762486 RepID=A0A1H2WRY7_9FLAO|nr:DDE-type integrase/transposase/recombinase [Lutibacter oricola]SDW83034.1 Integrase core domain-containing protein [Lutibacter oricola]
MKKYKSYHSSVKICYALSIENHLLPNDFLKSIKPSTAHYWKSDNPDKFVGSEFASSINHNIDDLQIIYDAKVQQLKKMFVTFCKVYLTILGFIGEKDFKSIIRTNRNAIVDLIDTTCNSVSERNWICKFLKITPHSYLTWKRYQDYFCEFSLLNLCFKRVPQQISRNEIDMLQSFMTNKRFYHWSVASIWGLAFKQDKTSMALSTWYRYAKRLGYTSARKAYKKKRKRISIEASTVNETWHMDVTYYKTLDNIQYYIYTIVDHFSRKILAYDVSKKLSASIRLASLKRAINNEFDDCLEKPTVELIVDGGSENNNHTINQFINNSQVSIHKKVALKDVTFSNSVIEGTYRILKNKYFQDRPILSSTIKREVDFYVYDYNNVRPHYIHKIYTPCEIHNNKSLKNVKPKLKNAFQNRINDNRKTSCVKNC